jgi:hypothetical protein
MSRISNTSSFLDGPDQGMARQPLAPHHLSRGVRHDKMEEFLASSMPMVLTVCCMGLVSSRFHEGQWH